MAGVAGALYVPQVGIINPSEFSPANSIEAVIWVAVGGRGTLTGAALGAVLVNYGKTTFTSGVLAPYWLFVLGGLFILVTLLLPRGPRSEPWSPAPHRRCSTSTASPCHSTASARSTTSRSPSSRARCAPSSARTAPARPP
jgi:urea transport system permease protein